MRAADCVGSNLESDFGYDKDSFMHNDFLSRTKALMPLLWLGALMFNASTQDLGAAESKATERRLLYVAEPGIRNYLEYGGHGVLVFDIDRDHRFVKRIASAGLDEKGQP